MAYAGGALGRVRHRRLVHEIGIRSQRQVAVSATLRNVEHAARFIIEFGAEPMTKGWASDTQVDGYIEHGAVGTAHKLDLGMRRLLIVHAPQRARRPAARRVDLSDSRVEPSADTFIRAPLSGEESSFVAPPLELDDEHAGDLSLRKDHG